MVTRHRVHRCRWSRSPNSGEVYNLRPTGTEPARVGIVVEAGGRAVEDLPAGAGVHPARARTGTGSSPPSPTSRATAAGSTIQITKVALTFNGQAQQGQVHADAHVVRGGHLAEPGQLVGRAGGLLAEDVRDDADRLRLARVRADGGGLDGRAGDHRIGSVAPVATTLRFDPEQAALKRAEVTLPSSLGPNVDALIRACPRAQADASALPGELARRHRDHRLAAAAAAGARAGVLRVQHATARCRDWSCMLPPPVGVRLDGLVDPSVAGYAEHVRRRTRTCR